MITSITAENSTDYIRRHITQKTINKGFSKVWLCIHGDGVTSKISKEVTRSKISIGLGKNKNPCILGPLNPFRVLEDQVTFSLYSKAT